MSIGRQILLPFNEKRLLIVVNIYNNYGISMKIMRMIGKPMEDRKKIFY